MIDFLLKRRRLLSDAKLLGKWGERRSERFLKKKGLKKLASNFCCRAGEIDLVMVDGSGAIVFVEVKTRADESFTEARAVVTSAKKSRIIRAARYFLASYKIESRPYRFDVITIVLGRLGRPQIKHYKSAFIA